MKKKYRIGTFTVGLLFMGLGIGLLLQHWFEYSMVSFLVNMWPVLLILLGGEILFFLRNRNKETEPNMSYDILGMCIVLLFAFVTVIMYAAQESGATTFLKQITQTASYEVQTPPETIDDLADIREVQIFANSQRVDLQTTEQERIMFRSAWNHIESENQDVATEQVEDVFHVQRDGDVLYITVQRPGKAHSFLADPTGNVTLEVPASLQLDADLGHAHADVTVDHLAADWNIQAGSINTDLQSPENISVQAYGQLQGMDDVDVWDEVNEDHSQGQLNIGEGEYSLSLKSNGGPIQALRTD